MTDAYNPYAAPEMVKAPPAGAGPPKPAGASPPAGKQASPQAGYGEARRVADKIVDTGLGNVLWQAATLGQGADIDAWYADAAASLGVPHDKMPFSHEEFRKAVRDAALASRENYEAKHPILGTLGEIGGSLLTPGLGEASDALAGVKIGGKQIPALIRNMLLAGGLGSAQTYGEAHGTKTERGKEAAAAFVPSALAGGAFHVGGRAAVKGAEMLAPHTRNVVGRMGAMLKPSEEKAAARAEASRRAGTAEVRERVDKAATKGVDLKVNKAEAAGHDITSAEALGDHAVERLRGVAKDEGPVRENLVPRIEKRQEGAANRVARLVAHVTGLDPEAIKGNFEKANEKLRAKAAPLYEKWEAHTNIDSPDLQRVRKTPGFRAAMSKAASMIANDPNAEHTAFEMGLSDDENWPIEMAGKPLMKAGGEPHTTNKVDAIKIAQQSGVPHSMLGKNEEPLPTAKGYDYVKRGLDELINKAKVGGEVQAGQLGMTELLSLRKALGAALTDERKPWGKDAAKAFAAGGDPIRQEAAFKDAPELFEKPPHDFAKALKKYGPAEAQALKAGFANWLRDLAGKEKLKFDRFLTDDMRANVKAAFGQHEGDKLIHELETERGLGKSGAKLTPPAKLDSAKMSERGHAHFSNAYHWALTALHGVHGSMFMFPHLFQGLAHGGADFLESFEGKQLGQRVGELLAMKPSELAAELEKEGNTPEKVGKVQAFLQKVRDDPNIMGVLRPFVHTGAARLGGLVGKGRALEEGAYNEGDAGDITDTGKSTPDDQSGNPYAQPGMTEGDKSPPPEKQASPLTKASYNADGSPKAFDSNEHVEGYLENTLGYPVTITSGYRDAEHNAEVGGAEHSAHMSGEAWDFTPHGVSMEQAGYDLAHAGIPFDQIEITPSHVHVSFAPAMRGNVIHVGFGKRPEPANDDAEIAASMMLDGSGGL